MGGVTVLRAKKGETVRFAVASDTSDEVHVHGYRIGALCPFCMAVWAVTIPAFWYVTLRNARPLADRPAGVGPVVRFALRNHGILITGWMLVIAALVVERFWA